MKTGCIFQARGKGVIAISLKVPKHLDGRIKRFERLAPLSSMLWMDKATYCRHFFGRILNDLDPLETWKRLHDLADGAEPILVCYEKPPFTPTNWCHRRILAAWFRDRLGEVVDELEPQAPAQLRLPGC